MENLDKVIDFIITNQKTLKVKRVGEDGEEFATLKDFEEACKKNEPKILKDKITVNEDCDYVLILEK